jgi:hypothetical protein
MIHPRLFRKYFHGKSLEIGSGALQLHMHASATHFFVCVDFSCWSSASTRQSQTMGCGASKQEVRHHFLTFLSSRSLCLRSFHVKSQVCNQREGDSNGGDNRLLQDAAYLPAQDQVVHDETLSPAPAAPDNDYAAAQSHSIDGLEPASETVHLGQRSACGSGFNSAGTAYSERVLQSFGINSREVCVTLITALYVRD